jgi:hypothetical protein
LGIVVFLSQFVDIVEGEFVCVIPCGDLGHNVPNGSQEVRQNEDKHDETYHPEDVHEQDLVHDLVVVLFVVFLAL